MASLGAPPPGIQDVDGPEVSPPPDVPPLPQVRPVAPTDPRLAGDDGDGRGGNGGGGSRRNTVQGPQTHDPHQAWVATSVIRGCESYWAAYRKRLHDAWLIDADERGLQPEQAQAEANALLADWDIQHPEDWRMTSYISVLDYEAKQLDRTRPVRWYRDDLLEFEAIRAMVDMEIQQGKAMAADAGGALALKAAKLAVATLPKNATREQILAAIAEVDYDAAQPA